MMGQSAFGEIAAPVTIDTGVQHFSKQLELLFLFQPPTYKRSLSHCLCSMLPVSAHSTTALKEIMF